MSTCHFLYLGGPDGDRTRNPNLSKVGQAPAPGPHKELVTRCK